MESTFVSTETSTDAKLLKGTPAAASSDTQSAAARTVAGRQSGPVIGQDKTCLSGRDELRQSGSALFSNASNDGYPLTFQLYRLACSTSTTSNRHRLLRCLSR
ncbi:hypothetical protein [Burkholderia ubonensis]|nr:hypothetical protein [Burkholderia ubonensis]